jgi:hypothetical protein
VHGHESSQELQRRLAELEAEVERWRVENDRLRAENARLKALVEELRRGGKRQAAPFSKGPPNPEPKPPGRKPGSAYGRRGHRAAPDEFDEQYEAPLPDSCPYCHSRELDETGVAAQVTAQGACAWYVAAGGTAGLCS